MYKLALHMSSQWIGFRRDAGVTSQLNVTLEKKMRSAVYKNHVTEKPCCQGKSAKQGISTSMPVYSNLECGGDELTCSS